MTLDKDTVFLVTGAAGSIVSAITADLAAASGGTFYLLDLVPEPDPANPDLKRFATDKEGLKRDLFARIQARGERATPALVERELAALERAQAARERHRRGARGRRHGTLLQRQPDRWRGRGEGHRGCPRSAAAASTCCCTPPASSAATSCPTRTRANSTWSSTSRATAGSTCCTPSATCRCGAMVGFSSIAGRFGNGGQTDYSSANDLLCKIASSFRSTRPETRAIAIDWTAWGGIGMATRGSIPKVMEMAGIDMLPPEAGVPWIRRELTAGGRGGEVVVAGSLGALLKEWDAAGGLDASVVPRGPHDRRTARHGPRRPPDRSRPRSTPRSSRSCTITTSTARRCCPA